MKFLKFNRVWYIKYLEAFKFGKALLIHTKPIANPIFSGVASTKKFFLQISIHYSDHTKRNLCETLQRYCGCVQRLKDQKFGQNWNYKQMLLQASLFYQVKIKILELPSLFISLNQTQNKLFPQIQISYTKLDKISPNSIINHCKRQKQCNIKRTNSW